LFFNNRNSLILVVITSGFSYYSRKVKLFQNGNGWKVTMKD